MMAIGRQGLAPSPGLSGPPDARGPGVMPPAGLRVLIPGYAQWRWGQRERGLVLFGSFASAAAVVVFFWGTATATILLLFAFVTHAVSTSDAVRQSAFPGPGRLATLAAVSLGLAVGVYGPALAFASIVAWPVVRTLPSSGVREVYLIDRSAYRSDDPRPDDRVWYRPDPSGEPTVGRVVAGRGQQVEWGADRLRVDGRDRPALVPLRSGRPPLEVSYRVPDRHALIQPEGLAASPAVTVGLAIVPDDQILGQAWACVYPYRARRFLE